MVETVLEPASEGGSRVSFRVVVHDDDAEAGLVEQLQVYGQS